MNRPARWLLAALLAAVMAFLPGLAHAADEIGLSRDGVRWSSSLDDSLFDPSVRWVPGDGRTEVFHVRNQGPSSAWLAVEVHADDPDGLVRQEDVVLSARADRGEWMTLEPGAQSSAVADRGIAPGEQVRIDLRANFDPESPNRSQNKEVSLSFRVTLTERIQCAGDECPGADPAGTLPVTGAVLGHWLLWLVAILIGVGTALVVARRKDRGDPHG